MIASEDEGTPCRGCGTTAVACQRHFVATGDWCCTRCRAIGGRASHRAPSPRPVEAQVAFPRPGDILCGRTVVASCWYIDDGREPEALVLLLNKAEPYFKIAHVQFALDPPVMVNDTDESNIVFAVRVYEQWGGDV